MEKTVFFGPFFGELGWEFAYWHGWVKKMCREKYQSYRKIVASYPGREPFYPDADEFWPHPFEIANLKISQRGYIADCWIGNLPKADDSTDIDKDIGQYAEKLLNEYRERLPKDTIFYIPHKLNAYHLNGRQYLIGTLFLKGLSFYKRPKTPSALFEHQIFENLKPTEKGKEFLNKLISPNQRIIAVFPRHRQSRRPDKSWPREKYDLLIKYLQKQYSDHVVIILGVSGDCYYADGVPAGSLDLINIPDGIRFNVHLAVLKRADIAIGGLSGAMRIAYATGCPTIEWGHPIELKNVKTYNCWAPFKYQRYIFWPEKNPSVENIQYLVKTMMAKKENEIIYPILSKIPKIEKTSLSQTFQTALREIVARIFLKYLKTKKLKEGVINSKLILIQ